MVHNDWYDWLQKEFKEDYFVRLAAFVHEAYEKGGVYPPKQQVFAAFENTDYAKIKVVILGQDPYHQKGQAHGMCFSVNPGVEPLPGHTPPGKPTRHPPASGTRGGGGQIP